jgi:molybdopterin molybdotransferase
LVCLVRYVIAGLDAACQAAAAPVETVALSTAAERKPALTLFVPVKLLPDGAGRALAELRPTQGSGDFISLIGTDGFVELPPGPAPLPAGSVVALYRW